MVIRVLPDGTIRCVYTDRFPLRRLGTLSVRRATQIDWDPHAEEWVAVRIGGEVIARGENREDVIRREVEWLERRLLSGKEI